MLEKEPTYFCYNFNFSELVENFMKTYRLVVILHHA